MAQSAWTSALLIALFGLIFILGWRARPVAARRAVIDDEPALSVRAPLPEPVGSSADGDASDVSLKDVATLAHRLREGIEQCRRDMDRVTDLARQSSALVATASGATKDVSACFESLRENLQATALVFKGLQGRADEIGGIVAVIKRIARQTNEAAAEAGRLANNLSTSCRSADAEVDGTLKVGDEGGGLQQRLPPRDTAGRGQRGDTHRGRVGLPETAGPAGAEQPAARSTGEASSDRMNMMWAPRAPIVA